MELYIKMTDQEYEEYKRLKKEDEEAVNYDISDLTLALFDQIQRDGGQVEEKAVTDVNTITTRTKIGVIHVGENKIIKLLAEVKSRE